MSKLIKIISFFFAVLLIVQLVTISTSAKNDCANVNLPEINTSAQSAILLDASDNSVLYAKNANLRLPMASTTKIMTALIALEYGNIDQKYAVPIDAVGVEGSSVYLVEGEMLTLGELVYALMLESANDAAEAIAIVIAGSTEAFADIMNRRANELELHDTHFTNPHGLDHEDHFTTAYDLARLASFAIKNQKFREIVSTRKATIPFNGDEGRRLLVNHNRLLREYRGAIGVKTGFTKRSGRCLVSSAERDGLTLVAVTINAPNDWRDHTAMLDWGFENYVHYILSRIGEYKLTMPVTGGNTQWTLCTNTQGICVTLKKDHGPISIEIQAHHFVYAPIKRGDKVGKLIYKCDGEIIGESALQITTDVQAQNIRKGFWQWLRSLFRF